jgi:hypothetical protein
MLDMKEIGQRLYQTTLIALDWNPFSNRAKLSFKDGDVNLILRLEQIHCVVFRQSTRRSTPFSIGPDCDVYFLDVSQTTNFLDRYLHDEKLFPSRPIPYDIAGHTPLDGNFQKPYHLSLLCSAGHVDIIADIVKLD